MKLSSFFNREKSAPHFTPVTASKRRIALIVENERWIAQDVFCWANCTLDRNYSGVFVNCWGTYVKLNRKFCFKVGTKTNAKIVQLVIWFLEQHTEICDTGVVFRCCGFGQFRSFLCCGFGQFRSFRCCGFGQFRCEGFLLIMADRRNLSLKSVVTQTTADINPLQ